MRISSVLSDLTQINSPTSPEPAEQTPEPTINLPQQSCLRDVLPEPEPNTGHGFWAWQEPGAYCRLNQGLDANLMTSMTSWKSQGELITVIWLKSVILSYQTVGCCQGPWMKNHPLSRKLLMGQMVLSGERDWRKRLVDWKQWRCGPPENTTIIPHSIVLKTKQGTQNEAPKMR